MELNAQGWSAVGSLLTAAITVALSAVTYFLYVATKRLAEISHETARHEAQTQLIEMLNTANELILGDDRNLEIAERLYAHDDMDVSPQAARERWVAFVLLNIHELRYFKHKEGHVSAELWTAKSERLLDRLLAHPHVLDLVENRGYHPEFLAYCRELASSKSQNSPRHDA